MAKIDDIAAELEKAEAVMRAARAQIPRDWWSDPDPLASKLCIEFHPGIRKATACIKTREVVAQNVFIDHKTLLSLRDTLCDLFGLPEKP